MKKIILIKCLFITTFTCFAQLSKDNLYGDWKVIQIVNKPNDVQFQALSNGFKNATFSFDENEKLKINTTFNSPMFNLFTEKPNNAHWIFDEKAQHIKIGSKQNKYAILGIVIKQQNNKILFHLDETTLVMEVEKQ